MIQAIGLMIGVYVITRMVSFLTRKEERAESIVVKILAVITMIVTLFCIFALMLSGQSIPR